MTVNEFTRCAGRREEEKDGILQQAKEEVLYEKEMKKESNCKELREAVTSEETKGR